MANQDIFVFLLWFFGIALGLYWLGLVLRSSTFWDWVLGVDYPSRMDDSPPTKTYPEPISYPAHWPEKWIYKPPPPVAPVVRAKRDFGTHINPLSVDGSSTCDGQFEQMDSRTWQCLKCHLLQFVEAQSEEAKS